MAGIGHRGFMGRSASAFCPYLPGLYTESEIDDLVFVDGYIPVYDAAELDKLRNSTTQFMGGCTKWGGEYTTGLDKKYVQIAPCDLSGISDWTPITSFTGTYDGNEIAITNLFSSTNGLFGTTDNEIHLTNIILQGEVDTNNLLKGLLIGVVDENTSTISNCHVSGNVNGTTSVGGFIGQNRGQISNCSFMGTVNGTGVVGGFVGANTSGGQIEKSTAYATVTFTGTGVAIGGTFVGRQQVSSSFIKKCKAIGDITHAAPNAGDRVCGGFIGVSNDGSLIEDCMAIGTATGRSRVGGFAGQLAGSNHVRCYCAVTVSGDGTFVGGYSNIIQSGGNTIEDCYFDVDVSGIPDTLAAEPRTTIQMQEGTEDSYILPGGGVDGSSDPSNLMYENWSSVIWDFGTDTDYPTLINTP